MALQVEVPYQTVFAIDYPGYVQDTEAALDTLGGIDSISQAHNGPGDVQVNCRPGDKLAHAIPAGKKLRNALLLRLSKPGSNGAQRASLCAEVVARVTCGYRFDGMADFQYINNSSSAEPASYPEVDGPFGKEREPLNIPPPLFSKQDTPQDYSFKTPPAPTSRPAAAAPAAAARPASGAQSLLHATHTPRPAATAASALVASIPGYPPLPSSAAHSVPAPAAGSEIDRTAAAGATLASTAETAAMPAAALAAGASVAAPSLAQSAAALEGAANPSAASFTALPSSGGGASAAESMDALDTT